MSSGQPAHSTPEYATRKLPEYAAHQEGDALPSQRLDNPHHFIRGVRVLQATQQGHDKLVDRKGAFWIIPCMDKKALASG